MVSKTEKSLKTIRILDSIIPDKNFLDFSSIVEDYADIPETPFDSKIKKIAANTPAGSVIAVDLDDTLLTNSYVCKNSWHDEGLNKAFRYTLSLKYSAMTRSLGRFLKYFWYFSRRLQHDPERYPFLRNPDVISEVRPGMLWALSGFRDANCKLILISATARRRLSFLLARLPILKKIFTINDKLCVISAEDILDKSSEITKKLEEENIKKLSAEDRLSLKAHIKRPMSLALKTPYLVGKILGMGTYDVLIDDSTVTFQCFKDAGLGHKIIKVSPVFPHTSYAMDIVGKVISRLKNKRKEDNEVRFSGSNVRIFNAKNYPYIRFEDPLYYPLIHVRDQVEV